MSSMTEGSRPAASNPVEVKRPARALIGWMAPEDGALWLAGRQIGHPEREEFIRRTVRAREAVAARSAGVDQSEMFQALPAELDAHIEALKTNDTSANLFHEGFRISLVDLHKVCAIQPLIYTASASDRLAGVDPASVEALAAVSLPIPRPEMMPVQFDPVKNAWIFSSANPNLRIAGHFSGEVQPGVHGFGFVVNIPKSYVQIAGYRGRYFLRDGYHRTFGLLALGVRWIPSLVREFSCIEEVGLPVGLLQQEAFLGDRPPLLTDYTAEDVSARIEVAATQKMVVVQGLELSTLS